MLRKVEIITRKPEPEDVEHVFRIAKESGLSHWKSQDYADKIGSDDVFFIVAHTIESKIPIAFILSRLITQMDCEILQISVAENSRKKGIGSLFLNELKKACALHKVESVFLEVRKSNITAQSFYLKNRFKEIGCRKNYYNHPNEDGLIFRYQARL